MLFIGGLSVRYGTLAEQSFLTDELLATNITNILKVVLTSASLAITL
jgi:hypothetical protein